uniref:Uncharacterized protein n=1 Tax=Lepeophtheirus salmonis TaxID=72036 RepID=A0A0K2SW65_LEPSM
MWNINMCRHTNHNYLLSSTYVHS